MGGLLLAGFHSDGLRVQSSSADVEVLAIVGTIRGVTPLAAAGKCGPGTAFLRSVPPGGLQGFQFKAPGGTYGATTFTPTTGDYLLEDLDPTKWIRVHVDLSWLASTVEESAVYLEDRYNALGPDDVDSSGSAGGITEVVQFTLLNASSDRIQNVKAWLGASAAGLSLSPDNVSFFSPTTEGTAVALGNVAKGASLNLWLKRVITAGASPSAATLNQVELSWDGL